MIASDVGGVAEALEGYAPSLLIPAGDDVALAVALARVVAGTWPDPREPRVPDLPERFHAERAARSVAELVGRVAAAPRGRQRQRFGRSLMLRRIFIVGGTGVIGALALALVQIKVGSLFGTGTELDAFFVGAALPSLLLSVSAGAIFSIVIPRLPDGSGGARAAGRFAALALVGGAVAAGVVALGAGPIVDLVAPGLSESTSRSAAEVLRIYAITIPPTSVAFAFSAYAYSIERPYVSGASTAVYGLVWFGLLFLAPFSGSAADVALAGVLATGVQVAVAFVLASPRGAVPWPVTRRLAVSRGAVVVAATVLGATMVGRLTLLLDPLFGSLLDPGSVSQLGYATRFMLLAVFVSGQGAAFSLLVVGRRRDVRSDSEARIAVVVPLLLSLGAAVIFAVCGPGLAQLLLARGELTSADAQQIGELLRIYAPAVVAITLIWTLEAVLYSAQRVREVFVRVVVGLLANFASSAALVALLRHRRSSPRGHRRRLRAARAPALA